MTTTGSPGAERVVLYDFEAVPAQSEWISYSPFVLKVERALRLARVDFQLERVSIAAAKRLNSTGQLPVVQVAGRNIRDSTQILQCIEREIAPGSLTRGLADKERGEAWLWEDFADTSLYPFVLATRWVDEAGWAVIREAFFGGLPPVIRGAIAWMVRGQIIRRLQLSDFIRTGMTACESELERLLDMLETRAPDVGFWVGSEPSVADLSLFGMLHALRTPAIPKRAAQVSRRVALSRWLERVHGATT